MFIMGKSREKPSFPEALSFSPKCRFMSLFGPSEGTVRPHALGLQCCSSSLLRARHGLSRDGLS